MTLLPSTQQESHVEVLADEDEEEDRRRSRSRSRSRR